MAYSELIKDFGRIRAYIREFYVYGFRSRDEFVAKSARSYDNERRRVESWLGAYMRFRQDESGKQVFLSLDSRSIAVNPIYQVFRAKSFTDTDILLHFFLLDMLRDKALTAREAADQLCGDYLRQTDAAVTPDESTVRKKLKEYEQLGLLTAEKQGREIRYQTAKDTVDLSPWRQAISFFAEDAPLGVIGSFFAQDDPLFRFKHRYLLDALDSEIMLNLLRAMTEGRTAELTIFSRRKGMELNHRLFPLRFFISTQTGRQYVLGYHEGWKKPMFYRLDGIRRVKLGEAEGNAERFRALVPGLREHLWGVSTGNDQSLDHIELDIFVAEGEAFIGDRLMREKRCGQVSQIEACIWRFTADVYDAGEMLPWIRTLIGRIAGIRCSSPSVVRRFQEDLRAMSALYGGGGDAVQ